MLCFEGGRSGSSNEALRRSRRALGVGAAALLLAGVGCGNDDDDNDEPATVALADSGTLAVLATDIGIPTTVAVVDGVAWVVESQFDRYAPFVGEGAGQPAPFRLIGVPLDSDDSNDYQEIPLPDEFFPEGIAASPSGRLFVGSVRTGAIYSVARDSAVPALFSSELEPSTLGMTVSGDNETLWVCNSDAATGTGGRVVGIDLSSGQIVATHTLDPDPAAPSFCNDLVMSPDGSLWVTESFGGRIFKIPADDILDDDSAELWLQDDELTPPGANQFGTNGIALLGGRLFTAVTDRSTLLAIDPTLEEPTGDDLEEITLFDLDDEPVELVRPDGITAVPGSDTDLLIVENGLNTDAGKRVVQARLDQR